MPNIDLESLWPDVRSEWILFEDPHIVVMNAPPGVPSQAADPSHPDDLVTRLRRYYATREGVRAEDIYLGVHQRLDAGTSGALVLTRATEANAGLAAAFESRAVEKRYVAAVVGWRDEGERVLEHHLAFRDGRAEVVRPGDPHGKPARLRARVRERCGERALLDIALETGRTHQIRAQLAAEGTPVAGDAAYGDVPAPRLLLHAAELEFAHPVHGERVHVEAPIPEPFAAWLRGDDGIPGNDAALADRIRTAVDARWGLARALDDTDVFRLLHGAADGVPGFALDRYGDFLVAHLMSDEAEANAGRLLDAASNLGFAGVYVKHRPRQASTLVDTRRDEVAPSCAVRGHDAPEEFVVHELGLPLHVRLGDGLSTGVFLDQRTNRARVAAWSAGKRVLNLFSYTCAFTVAAVRGGATSTLSVDAAQPALDWGRRNVGLPSTDRKHEFARVDAFELLAKLAEVGRRFDVIVADPPTYATTKRSRFESGRDWIRLAAAIFRVSDRGARVLLSSNDQRMPVRAFERFVRDGAREAGVAIAHLRLRFPPSDFPTGAGAEPLQKAVEVELA
ncbi:MAG: class I SAM-dependent methyltransferase [Polyangiales bacterium]